ncbi:MAG TPA: GNAT family N-acetyltransferase [Streptosporangiaceae bacterium]|nr:GNAT family N-acetyltransferase [Streptosporangiaceae bacterium]
MGATRIHRLADGRRVVLRPAGPADVTAIARLYAELSPGSFQRRFLSGRPAPAILARLAGLASGVFCLMAVPADDPGTVAGEARYVPDEGDIAELALTVRDSYQGAGLGHVLLDGLAQQARQDGLGELRAVVLLDNGPMLHLLQRHGCALAAPSDDYCVASLDIGTDGGMPGWPPDSAGRRVLVERRGWFEDARNAALRAAGYEVRQCPGPLQQAGRPCPLLTAGTCRLAEQADQIVSGLPPGDPECAAVLAEHQRRWPGKLAAPGDRSR